MPIVRYQDRELPLDPGVTVLECLTTNGITITSSCRSGVCQTCLMRATDGVPPAKSQEGLKSTLKEQGYFLSCVCRPTESISVALPGEDAAPRTPCVLVSKESLNRDIVRLVLEGDIPQDTHPGQFFNLKRLKDGLTRSYSAASVLMGSVEFHVRKLPGGLMSTWLYEDLKPGDLCELSGPQGSCFYTVGNPAQPLLLLGTGSGLAPLWGIINDALAHGHTGPIYLYHGSWNRAGLYLVNALQELAMRHANFRYIPCIDSAESGDPIAGERIERADLTLLAEHRDLTGYRVFLCGHPEMIRTAKRKIFLAGANMGDIYADPFVVSHRQ